MENFAKTAKFSMKKVVERMELLEQITKQEQQERLHISRILDVARDYLEREQYDLASAFMKITKNYDKGKYKGHIEAMKLHCEIAQAFEMYQERMWYAS